MQHYAKALDAISREVQATFGPLSAEDLNAKTSQHSWSIAQNLHHLMVVNSSYFPTLEAVSAGRYSPPFAARFGFWARLASRMLLQSVRPDRQRRMKTLKPWEPSGEALPDNIVGLFLDHQTQLQQQLSACEKHLQQGVVIASPTNRNVVYPLETAYELIVNHEWRHLEQAKEVKEWLRDEGKLS